MRRLSRHEAVIGAAAAIGVPRRRLRAASLAGFTHRVASGEPTAASVLLSTRFRGGAGPVPLGVEVAREPGFRRVIARGSALAARETKWTARATLSDQPPGSWLCYRWVAPEGSRSPTGRTRTLPDGPCNRFAIALFSCSNLGFGWFNAIAHASGRTGLDLAVHPGDCISEYPLGTYPSARDIVAGRTIAPEGPLLALADRRFSDSRALNCFRLDGPDPQPAAVSTGRTDQRLSGNGPGDARARLRHADHVRDDRAARLARKGTEAQWVPLRRP